MKIVKVIMAVAVFSALFGSCKTKECPGYGEVQQNETQVEQQA